MALSLDGTTGISASGNIVGNNISVSGSLTAGTFSPSSLSASGNVTGGNLVTAGLITATGNITSAASINLGGNIVDSGALNIITGSNGNLTLNAGTGFIVLDSGIINGQANGVGNIGNATGYFNTVFAKATSAQYADLAEMYEADAVYEPGTVLCFGGSKEVTLCIEDSCRRVAGVVSTNPSYIMNAGLQGDHVVAVALTGRVPTRVTGTIRKGDRLVSSDIPGVATVLDATRYEPGCIIGKAIEAYDSLDIGCIEVAVGRY